MPIWNYVFATDWLRLIINTREKNRSMWPTNSPQEKNRLNYGVIGRKLSDRYNDSAIDEPLQSESKGGETPDTDKIA